MSQIGQFIVDDELIKTITGDIGAAVGPDILNNVDFLGGTYVTVTGVPLTNTLTITLANSIVASFVTDAGTAVSLAHALTVSGGTNINTAGAAAVVTVHLDDTITLSTVNATTFDTNVVAAGVTLQATELAADGTDANIDITIVPKGTGQVIINDLQLLTPLAVSEGGTGLDTLTDHGILVGSGANVITTLAPNTAGYVLMDGGAGVDPSWVAPTVGTVTSVSGGTNITASGTAADPIMDLDAAITGMTSITMADTGSIQTTVVDTDTMLIQGYDVDGTVYVPFITITNANIPTCDLNTGVTIGTKYIYRADGTDVSVADGGTSVSTFTDHGVLVGNTTNAITATAEGATGVILTGVTGNEPVWTTATYPATVAIGDVLVASAANVIGVVTGGTTAGHVLKANGAGTAPTFQAEDAAAFCSDAEAVDGTITDEAVSPSTLKAKLGAQTSHGLPYGAATTGAIAWTAEPTDGQLIIGDTGGVPALGTLTAGVGVQVTNAAHSITVASTGTTLRDDTSTSDTWVIGDAGKHITYTNGAAIAVTVPPNASVAFAIGTIISFSQGGAGQITLAGAGPPTLQSADSALTTVKIYSGGCAIKILSDTWRIFGDMEA